MSKRDFFGQARVVQALPLRCGPKALLLNLLLFADSKGEAWPAHSTLAAALGADRRAVQNWQRELQERGLLIVESGGGRAASNRYRVNLQSLENSESGSQFEDINSESGSQFKNGNCERHSGNCERHSINCEPRSHRTAKNSHEQPKEARAAVPVPESLASSPAFQSAWKDWLAYRRERRKALTPKTAERQLSKLAKWGADKSIRAIERSIENGWAGIFDPDDNRGTGSGPAGSAEALAAWDRLRSALREHSSLNASAVRAAVGEAIFAAAKTAGGLKAIEQATDFERRDIQNRFNSSFTKGCK